MADPVEQENNRNPDGTFKPGISGNPSGRPTGSVSIVGMIRKKFEESPEYFNEWVDKLLEDPRNRKDVMQQLDGRPKQSVELGGPDGGPIQIEQVEISFKE
jgi:hypothetical protein